MSNTVWFERALGWSGVLIEASSKAFRSLVQHRGGGGNSLHNAVICPRGQTVIYREPHSLASVTMAGIDASMPATNKRYRDNRHASLRELPCRPLSELLAATHESFNTPKGCLEDHVPLCPYLSAAGLDAVRLLRRDDEGSDVLGEVVDLSAAVHIRLFLKDACVDGLGSGWDGRQPCACNDSFPVLNCFGTQLHRRGVHACRPRPGAKGNQYLTPDS